MSRFLCLLAVLCLAGPVALASPEHCFLKDLKCVPFINSLSRGSFSCGDGYYNKGDYQFSLDVWGHGSYYGIVVSKGDTRVYEKTIWPEELKDSEWQDAFYVGQDKINIYCYPTEK